MRAVDYGDGYWSCRHSELKESTVANLVSHFTAEERARAIEAKALCGILGHPGSATIQKALDDGVYSNTHLTSQDHRNCIEINGPCTACLEAKDKTSPEKTSLTAPATKIGQHLHCDLFPLKEKSLGGNVGLLVSVDERSGAGFAPPIQNKTTRSLEGALEQIILHYNSHGHRVERVTCDDEVALASAMPFLAKKWNSIQRDSSRSA